MKMLALVVALLGAVSAWAQSGTWAQVGGWIIRVDASVGNGCFAAQEYEDGTFVRIGVDVDSQKIYLLFSNDAWKSLEFGKVYPMRITFDSASPYDGEMSVIRLHGGAIMLAHRNLSSDFVKDFMQRNVMRIYYKGNRITSLSLRNTYAAIGEVFNCQKEFGFGSNRSPRSSDPFSSSGGGQTRDPFR